MIASPLCDNLFLFVVDSNPYRQSACLLCDQGIQHATLPDDNPCIHLVQWTFSRTKWPTDLVWPQAFFINTIGQSVVIMPCALLEKLSKWPGKALVSREGVSHLTHHPHGSWPLNSTGRQVHYLKSKVTWSLSTWEIISSTWHGPFLKFDMRN